MGDNEMINIEFDEYGNPKPYEVVRLSYGECKNIFVEKFKSSATRKLNWTSFMGFHTDIEAVSTFAVKHWIDGSFVTQKINPNDIDVVSFVNPNNLVSTLREFDMNKSDPSGYVKNKYNVDNYIIVDFDKGHPYYDKMQEQVKYWREFFSTDRNEKPKAIVEVVS